MPTEEKKQKLSGTLKENFGYPRPAPKPMGGKKKGKPKGNDSTPSE